MSGRGIRLLRSQRKRWLPPTKLGHMYFPTSRYIASALLSRPQRRWSRCQMPKTNPFDHCVSHKRQTHTSQD